mmetsp:Transcript_15760/g.30790  ORF Transcript_15760/g.30790 Transcript_15760/m.30790 type:complete len:808 (-) Transcript_15760:236-2659(-)
MDKIGGLSIEDLLDTYISCPGRSSKVVRNVQTLCNDLFAKDYEIGLLDNEDGSYCSSYPLDLIIVKKERRTENAKSLNTSHDLGEHFLRGRFARVRGRFPIPVILWNNKNICRSSTISVQAEVLLNLSTSKIRDIHNKLFAGHREPNKSNGISYTVEAQRKCDTEILSKLDIKYICDLMVERHKIKMGVVCSSSEKAEGDLYENFTLQPMPYPGCEFFKVFKDNKRCGRDLKFDWECSYIDAKLVLPPKKHALDVNWEQYKNWDVVVLTQNYFRLIMGYITDASTSSGVLVHCISGWDRTPLFISLLRLSLWADGEIHTSLGPQEILFLTLGYDWMLFSHLLDDRIAKGEDIFYFCFYMLPFIAKAEFSVIAKHATKALDPPPSLLLRDTQPQEKADKKNDEANVASPTLTPRKNEKQQESKAPIDDPQPEKFLLEENHFARISERKVIQGFSVSESGLSEEIVQKSKKAEPETNSAQSKFEGLCMTVSEESSKKPPEPIAWGSKVEEESAKKAAAVDSVLKAKSQRLKTKDSIDDVAMGRRSSYRGMGVSSSPIAISRREGSLLRRECSMSDTELEQPRGSLTTCDLYRSVSAGGCKERSSSDVVEQKVSVGSWQLVNAELHSSNSPSHTTPMGHTPSGNTPPLFSQPSPPVLRRPSSLEQDHGENVGRSSNCLAGSFTVKRSPMYHQTMETIAKTDKRRKDGHQDAHAQGLDTTRAPMLRAEQSQTGEPDSKKFDRPSEVKVDKKSGMDAPRQESAVALNASKKLIRREQRLRMVHDLFMQAYKDRIDSRGSQSRILRWLPKSLY